MDDAAALIRRLRETGKDLSPALRARIVACGDVVVGDLIDLMIDEEAGREGSPSDGWAPGHAVEILGEMKVTRAIEPMLDVLMDLTLDAALASPLLRRLAQFGPLVVEPALRRLEALDVEDAEAEDMLVAALARLGVRDDRIFEAICRIFDEDEVGGAMYFADYGSRRALPRLYKAIEGHVPDYSFRFWRLDHADLVDAYLDLGGALDDNLKARIRALDIAAAAASASTAKTGRNDPCPCGSGKKFKKCCVDKVAASG